MSSSSPQGRRWVVLRDDDTNALTDPACLERLYRPFLDRGLVVNLAVIPEVDTGARRLDGRPEEFVRGAAPSGGRVWIGRNRELTDYLQRNPGYHVVQHGYDHTCMEFARHDRRDLARRLDDGAARLVAAGFAPPETFVAPQDRISREGFALAIRRFRVISTGWFEWRRLPRRWWPAYLWQRLQGRRHWSSGHCRLLSHPGCLLSRFRPRAGMLDRIRAAVAAQPLTVLVTHWWEYFPDGRPDAEFIDILHRTADFLAGESDLRVVAFSKLDRSPVPPARA